MSEQKKTQSSSTDESGGDAGQDEVQEKFDEAEEQGFFGTSPDKTPRENYTVKGVGAGKPTPETERGKEALEAKNAEK